jgi:hypothetical protein
MERKQPKSVKPKMRGRKLEGVNWLMGVTQKGVNHTGVK